MGRAAWFAGGLATAAVIFLAYQLFLAPGGGGVRVTAPPPRPTPFPLTIQVAGEVVAPGVYQLEAGSRVEDAVGMAGGATENGDASLLNLAARLTDGQRIVVPRRGGLAGAASGQSAVSARNPATGSVSLLNLNAASLADLESLPGIGRVTAQKIVDQRDKRPFASVDELLHLRLVPANTFERIRELVTIG